MISSFEKLRSRGYLTDSDFNELKLTNSESIIECLHSKDAVIRTFAVRKINDNHEIKYLNDLCNILITEKKLYTKLEICNCLSNFGESAIESLIPLLGKIGNNQHKRIGNFDLNKKSFPLPRDIVGRILIRMGPVVLKYLQNLIKNCEITVLSEAIDIIGYISLDSGSSAMENSLFDIYNEYDVQLVKWKIVRAFQAFSSNRVTIFLEKIISNSENEFIKNEAVRSLERIKSRSA